METALTDSQSGFLREKEKGGIKYLLFRKAYV